MNRIITYFFITFIIMNISISINAGEIKTAYVSDVLILTVRTGPGKTFEIFKTIESNEQLLILEEKGNYSKIQLSNGDIGWVQSQYLTFKTPDNIIIAKLKRKIQNLIIKNNLQEKNIEILSRKSKDNQTVLLDEKNKLKTMLSQSIADKNNCIEKYSKIKKNYNDLLKKSKTVVAISKENENLKESNKELLDKLEDLEYKNKTLLKIGMIKWFLSGAGVIFLGWIIGRSVTIRRPRSSGLLR